MAMAFSWKWKYAYFDAIFIKMCTVMLFLQKCTLIHSDAVFMEMYLYTQ